MMVWLEPQVTMSSNFCLCRGFSLSSIASLCLFPKLASHERTFKRAYPQAFSPIQLLFFDFVSIKFNSSSTFFGSDMCRTCDCGSASLKKRKGSSLCKSFFAYKLTPGHASSCARTKMYERLVMNLQYIVLYHCHGLRNSFFRFLICGLLNEVVWFFTFTSSFLAIPTW